MAVGTLDLRGWANICLTKQAIPHIENKYEWKQKYIYSFIFIFYIRKLDILR